MKIKATIGCFMLFGMPMAGQVNDEYIGRWENKEKSAVIDIYAVNDMYYGKLVVPAVAGTPVILVQMKRKKNVLYGGTFQNTAKHTENEARVRLINDSTFVLKEFTGIFRHRSKWFKKRKEIKR